ncbi:uncharacterized protein I303_106033 [Kwoniella dejecticola CBS 10117]|uniref:Uncharacterized protein n=1 Tax=Kwoniella dejecticola CBS 10117 TaxID=1296121 RepID=A0A1A6A130_9TREE|nr:uncharacterized protein I303_06053 [Kwoniella dejecticola CBS 10117]OBR83771.1 hypothetical protein I303_06053 [Kwoniella dejecticola CBS 10117]
MWFIIWLFFLAHTAVNAQRQCPTITATDTVTDTTTTVASVTVTTTTTDTLSYCTETSTYYETSTDITYTNSYTTGTVVSGAGVGAVAGAKPGVGAEDTKAKRELTNAERLQRGLPLLKPHLRSPHAGRYGSGAKKRQDPSCTTDYVTITATTTTTSVSTPTETETTYTCLLTSPRM